MLYDYMTTIVIWLQLLFEYNYVIWLQLLFDYNYVIWLQLNYLISNI
jgi:hypothetical protein